MAYWILLTAALDPNVMTISGLQANRAPLMNGLLEGLRAGRANMAANAKYWRHNVSADGLALTCGIYTATSTLF